VYLAYLAFFSIIGRRGYNPIKRRMKLLLNPPHPLATTTSIRACSIPQNKKASQNKKKEVVAVC
jgi:hypothetical protein